MTEYKLVPVEPTEEMMEAGHYAMVDGYHPGGVYADMLAAAPAVQGEPVGFCEDTVLSLAERTFSSEVDEQLAEDVIRYARRLHDMYAAPQSAEQPVSHDWDDQDKCRRCGDRDWYASATCTPKQQPITCVGCEGSPAPENSPCAVCGQKPDTDVTQLVEALKQILGWRELRSGQEFPIDRIEDVARAALVTYHKGSES